MDGWGEVIKKDVIPTYDQALQALSNGGEQIIRQAIFPFKYYDGEYVCQVAEAIRSLLNRSDLTPAQIVSVGRVLHGLHRMPLRTPGLDIQISLSIVNPGGGESYTLHICEDEFSAESSGYIDSDNLSGFTFSVDTVGRDEHGSNFSVESWPEAFEQLNFADLHIDDDSENNIMDWEHPDGSDFWEWIAKHD
jgi:hypothetical protein